MYDSAMTAFELVSQLLAESSKYGSHVRLRYESRLSNVGSSYRTRAAGKKEICFEDPTCLWVVWLLRIKYC